MKPSLPKGTRDFNAEKVNKRNFIRDTITRTYAKYGFEPLETPSMEMLSTLTGKYGADGEQLLFRILRSGDFLKKADPEALNAKDSKGVAAGITERGLRYDLTVPFARYVVQHQHELAMPFKRYQVQPVWRADRPQKGRYQEFWQCDADVIGSNSLLSETEFIQIYDEVFGALGIKATVRINNRKILNGLASLIKAHEFFGPICVAIDKLDKIGMDGVRQELLKSGLDESQSDKLIELLSDREPNNMLKLNNLGEAFAGDWIDPTGIDEMRSIFGMLFEVELKNIELKFDLTLARGLSYYTGTIFEVIDKAHPIGSISGGGRYDDLTGVFGLKGMSGVGISFGLERIFDILEEQGWPVNFSRTGTRVIFICFDESGMGQAMQYAAQVREHSIATEIYSEPVVKMGKKMKYVDRKGIPFAALLGSDEIAEGKIALKDMSTGDQEKLTIDGLIDRLV